MSVIRIQGIMQFCDQVLLDLIRGPLWYLALKQAILYRVTRKCKKYVLQYNRTIAVRYKPIVVGVGLIIVLPSWKTEAQIRYL